MQEESTQAQQQCGHLSLCYQKLKPSRMVQVQDTTFQAIRRQDIHFQVCLFVCLSVRSTEIRTNPYPLVGLFFCATTEPLGVAEDGRVQQFLHYFSYKINVLLICYLISFDLVGSRGEACPVESAYRRW